jgi:hypothetical protein
MLSRIRSSAPLLLHRRFSYSPSIPRVDDADKFPLRERQEALLLERVPMELNSAEKIAAVIGSVEPENILLMKSGIGEFTGRVAVLGGPTLVISPPGQDSVVRSLDRADTALFVEQCKRYTEFTHDLRRIAEEASKSESGFQRIVTLTGLPKSYTRADVMAVISEATNGLVRVENPLNIVFRFKKNGYQSDTCFVLLETADDCHAVIKSVQEYAVPKRRVYGTSFGCSFVYADRSALFVSAPSVDYILGSSKNWVLSLGWSSDLDETQLRGVLEKLAIYPNKIVKLSGIADNGGFLLRFDRMKNTKLVFSRLNRLKKRWRIGTHIPFFAFPVQADIHFQGDECHPDEASDCDSDLDEPVMY